MIVARLRSQLSDAMNIKGKRLVSSILVAWLLRDVWKNGACFTLIPLRPFTRESARFPVRANLENLFVGGIC